MHYRVPISVLAAGMLACAAAVGADAPNSATTLTRNATTVSSLDFRTSAWLGDRKVVGEKGEEIAKVSELILDRGTGRVEYMVIKTGTTFGLGGRAVAVPFGFFKWEAGDKDRFVLATTVEQLKMHPEYTPESWKALQSTKDDKDALCKKLTADAATPSDPYVGHLEAAKNVHVEGVVRKVERLATSTCGEQVVMSVEESGGAIRKVALGPSWFVSASPASPARGDKVVVDTLALPRDTENLLVATELKTEGRKLQLRDGSGKPAWALKHVQNGATTCSAAYSRYLLMSSLIGMKVDCRGEECGKVDAIIVDRSSGEIGFLSIDPNEKFMGIGDKMRLLPWSVATVTLAGVVRIDASKEMVLATPETPAELAVLNTGERANDVYKAFEVGAPRFDPPKVAGVSVASEAGDVSAKDAWAAQGVIVNAIESDSAKVMTGTVVEVMEVKFAGGAKPASAMKIRQAGDAGGEDVVLTGPSWFMENHQPSCEVGDMIRLEAVRTTIEGQKYWIARSIDCKNTRVVMITATNSPAWDQKQSSERK